jgi:hypothetical protein
MTGHTRYYRLAGWLSLILLVTACQALTTASTPTAEPQTPVRRLATVAPTRTLSAEDQQATQAAQLTPTAIPPTPSPTATPYVGVFLGEAEPPESGGFFGPAEISGPGIRDLDELVLPQLCALPPDDLFGSGWIEERAALSGLRCPIQEQFGADGIVQVFENGVMYLRTDTLEVWAIQPGSLTERGRFWYVEQPPDLPPPGVSPPPGLRLPEGAFGSVWSIVPAAREALGYATTQAQPTGLNLQRFEGGTLFLDAGAGQVFALLINGDAFGPY